MVCFSEVWFVFLHDLCSCFCLCCCLCFVACPLLVRVIKLSWGALLHEVTTCRNTLVGSALRLSLWVRLHWLQAEHLIIRACSNRISETPSHSLSHIDTDSTLLQGRQRINQHHSRNTAGSSSFTDCLVQGLLCQQLHHRFWRKPGSYFDRLRLATKIVGGIPNTHVSEFCLAISDQRFGHPN